jgi:hypothetical protein
MLPRNVLCNTSLPIHDQSCCPTLRVVQLVAFLILCNRLCKLSISTIHGQPVAQHAMLRNMIDREWANLCCTKHFCATRLNVNGPLNKPNSKFAQHMLDTQDTYDTIEKTMDIFHFGRNSPHLNALERFYIHNLSAQKLQMNDTYTDIHNPIFNLILKQKNRQWNHGSVDFDVNTSYN